jgi:Kef-type K+ transport system membrane component KefB
LFHNALHWCALQALAKYAFGLGTLQMLLCTAIFSAFALPLGHGVGTQLLEWLAHAPPSLVSIRSIDEVRIELLPDVCAGLVLSNVATDMPDCTGYDWRRSVLHLQAIVIGGALSMSSSAFVLQLLSERGEMPTRFGAATLGVLLLQVHRRGEGEGGCQWHSCCNRGA